jgi:putative glutamine amidotransferase
MGQRPLIAVPGRFSTSASALRYHALANAQALLAAVWRAGGEPVTLLPWAPAGAVTQEQLAERLAFVDGVLLPGGGDLDPVRYGQSVSSDHVYDVNPEQDAFDLALARWAIDSGTPLLAVCRGMQVVTVALGGTLEQHMDTPHRHVLHSVDVDPETRLAATIGSSSQASCYHHQRIDQLPASVNVVARASDGTVEGIDIPDARGWFLGVQWHPEDTAADDASQQALFDALVAAAAAGRR